MIAQMPHEKLNQHASAISIQKSVREGLFLLKQVSMLLVSVQKSQGFISLCLRRIWVDNSDVGISDWEGGVGFGGISGILCIGQLALTISIDFGGNFGEGCVWKSSRKF